MMNRFARGDGPVDGRPPGRGARSPRAQRALRGPSASSARLLFAVLFAVLAGPLGNGWADVDRPHHVALVDTAANRRLTFAGAGPSRHGPATASPGIAVSCRLGQRS